MGDFSISVGPQGVLVNVNEFLPETDIQQMLTFDENQLEELLQNHAAIQVYWEALATRLKKKYETFKDVWVKKWMAHSKTYARYVMLAYGDNKPLVDAINDQMILIYSQDATPFERRKYLELAFRIASSRKLFSGTKEEFEQAMFKYILQDPPWYFETVIETQKKAQEDWEHVAAVAKRLESRSYHMHSLINLVVPKRSNIGPQSVMERNHFQEMSARMAHK